MQLLADYFPLILFFLAFKLQGIMVATAVAIVASVAQIIWFKRKGTVSTVHWISLAIIVVFGGATLILQDEVFIKWKPTVLYGAFGLTLLVGKLVFRRDLISYLLKDIVLPSVRVDPRHVGVGRVLRGDGAPQLVRRVQLLHGNVGELQGVGRHRSLPAVRAGAGTDARPLCQRAHEAMTRTGAHGARATR